MLSLDSIPGIVSYRQIRAYEGVTEMIETFDDYNDVCEIFKHFFRCSILNRWDCFDFISAFETTIPFIQNKLAIHGCMSLSEYTRCVYGDGFDICDHPDIRFEYRHIRTSVIDCVEYARMQYILDVYANIEYAKSNCIKIVLFDAIIDAEHLSGNIFEWEIRPDDPNSLREKVNKELLF